MFNAWTFARKIAIGYAIAVVCIVVVGAAAIYNLRRIIIATGLVQRHSQNLIDTEDLHAAALLQSTGLRGFLFTGNERFAHEMQAGDARFRQILATLRPRVLTPQGNQFLIEVEQAQAAFTSSTEQVAEMRRRVSSSQDIIKVFETQTSPSRERVERILNAFLEHERQLILISASAGAQAEAQAVWVVVIVAVAAVMVAVLLTVLLTRDLAGRIGPAVQHVQVSASQLQSTANQQASGSRQHAAVITEIMTTMKELLATSRQIAENAQRAAAAATDGSSAARSGEQVVSNAQSAVAGIKRQFDRMVEHMLDLGRKSQQIGAIVNIVNELAEQTNILAINATIEAAGAGEAGKRFAAVADEIRKLSDRVTGSTKEINDLIDEVRAAANSTVMSIESGAKVVDTGTHDVGEVAAAFAHIAQLADAVTEAAREIELNTRQQSSAVNQVNTAVGEVAQAARELESASAQTLQTSSVLSGLSHDLARLIEPQPAA